MSEEMRTWTWEEIVELLRQTGPSDYWGRGVMADAIRNTPIEYRRAFAAALTVAKWNPQYQHRYARVLPCGLCAYYKVECSKCALWVRCEGVGCFDTNSLFHRAYHDQNKDAERELFNVLCEIYKEEYDKLP